ncbi:MAG: hypothetical protein IJQ97_04460 [Paludibacteraceae bacterium]|nr:hypothetical protein [Paludibacteraceae bacterium]
MKKTIITAFACLIGLMMPSLAIFAEEEVVIELLELFIPIPGNIPLDGSDHADNNPPRPLDFRATITGRTLAITSGTHVARVIVKDEYDVEVLDRQFVGGTVEQMPTSGNFSLEIQSGSLTLVGVFEAE